MSFRNRASIGSLNADDLMTSPAFVVRSAGNTFQHPTRRPNERWQTDCTYLHIVGWGWYSLSTVLDDDSRDILAWRLRPTMQATDVMEPLDLARAATGLDDVPAGGAERPRCAGRRDQARVGRWRSTKPPATLGRGVPSASKRCFRRL